MYIEHICEFSSFYAPSTEVKHIISSYGSVTSLLKRRLFPFYLPEKWRGGEQFALAFLKENNRADLLRM